MTYFEDLTDYEFITGLPSPHTKNVGWLGCGNGFKQMEPSEDFLDLLWEFCQVPFAQTRGFHTCEFCAYAAPREGNCFMRHGKKLMLGTAEIRAFGNDGTIYAAPNLIYHYVSEHHYAPPEEFIAAICNQCRPPQEEYFKRLMDLDPDWDYAFARKRPLEVRPQEMQGNLELIPAERLKVWGAWSEMFLDTELSDKDIERIAKILAESPFSRDELEHIYCKEVAPVCGPNLTLVAGEWGCFDSKWLLERCSRQHKANPYNPSVAKRAQGLLGRLGQVLRAPFTSFYMLMVDKDYHRVVSMIDSLRSDTLSG